MKCLLLGAGKTSIECLKTLVKLRKNVSVCLNKDELVLLQSIMKYPISEKFINCFRCLRDHGIVYTLKRILFGRQS